MTQEIERRFWDKVDWDLRDLDRCWPWTASKMWRGYGQFRLVDIHGKQYVVRAHRLAYEFEYGPIPEIGPDGTAVHIDHMCHDPVVCHAGEACPHRACCNPSHMKLSSNADNHRADRADASAGALQRVARLTVEERRAWNQRIVTAKWAIPGARESWAQTKKQWWADLTPERRAEIGDKISRARRRTWAETTPERRAEIGEKQRRARWNKDPSS